MAPLDLPTLPSEKHQACELQTLKTKALYFNRAREAFCKFIVMGKEGGGIHAYSSGVRQD